MKPPSTEILCITFHICEVRSVDVSIDKHGKASSTFSFLSKVSEDVETPFS